MSRLYPRIRLALRALLRRRQADEELAEELQYHLDRQIEQNLAAGMAPEEARRAARRTLGAVTQNQEACRDQRALGWIEDLARDLRHGARGLRRDRGFGAAALLMLALGIGATTAMFSVVYGILLRPLPYADADRLVVVNMTYGGRDRALDTMSVRDYLTWRDGSRAFDRAALVRTHRVDVGGREGATEQVAGASVTAGFFATLGVAPLIGRTFAAGEDAPAAAAVAVLGESIWRRRFAASPAVLGRTILIGGAPATIVGVMPAAFQLPQSETEIWTNLLLVPPTRSGPWLYRGLARLAPGVTLAAGQAELDQVAARLVRQNPAYQRVTLPALGLRDALVGVRMKPALGTLAGAVLLVLLIALANVANLMLARASGRGREMALRLSLGARRGRLVRQLLAESLLLALLGAAAGVVLAWGSVALVRAWNPGNLPLVDSVRLDGAALAFTVLIATVAAVLSGLLPALRSARADLSAAIRDGSRGSAGPTRGRLRRALVASEIALALVLLVGAGLLLRSFQNLQRVSGGFSAPPQQVLTMRLSAGDPKYREPAALAAFYDEVTRRAGSVPGVELAALGDALPPDRLGNADTFHVLGQTLPAGETNPVVPSVTASPGFFAALRIPLLEGRYFTAGDREGTAPVALVSEKLARRLFPPGQALGRRIRQGGGPWMEIVGVVGNVKYLGLTVDTAPAYYLPFAQAPGRRMFLIARAAGDAAPLAETLRREVQAIDPGVAIAQIRTLEEALDRSFSQPRFQTILLAAFAGIALLLAALGIYGLIAYWVAQRTQEIGVRMAVGAAPRQVLRLVVGQGLSLAALGTTAGLAGAFALTRALATMLFGVGATDPLTFVAAPLAILLIVTLAASLPALRATRISPMSALRCE
jgi:putative ABC transport system permease protein